MFRNLSIALAAASLLTLSACDRDSANSANPEEAPKAQAEQAAAAPKAEAEQAGESASLRAELPKEGSSCPEGRGPGDKWKVDCNTCYCSPEGKVACTLMACIGDE